MKIVLTGANGQLGSDLRKALTRHEVIGTTRAELDVTQPAQSRAVIETHRPHIVINTTAYNKVDAAESDASVALAVNGYGAQQLALACRDFDIPLVHISTDFVFDGAKGAPYVESDLPNPLSAYGASKLSGELLVRAAWRKHFIVRTCGLYGIAGSSGKGGNFVNTMLRLARESKPMRVVSDQICTPTSTRDLAAQIAALIETDAYGTVHINNHGSCSWLEFASEIMRLARLQPDLQPTTSASVRASYPAVRPPYSVLDNAALRCIGIDQMRDWREALAEYVADVSRETSVR
jgi:dTDP-4-dehydrorhamnose reductase